MTASLEKATSEPQSDSSPVPANQNTESTHTLAQQPEGAPDDSGAPREIPRPPQPIPCASSTTAAPFRWLGPENIRRRKFAPGGIGKTAVVLAECLALAAGKDIFKTGTVQKENVWYIGLEDSWDEYQRRVAAAVLLHDLDVREIEKSFFLNIGLGDNFVISERTRWGNEISHPMVEAMAQSICDRNIGLVVVDPFIASHRVSENDNTTIAAMIRAWSDVAAHTNAAIELVHHTRKGSATDAPKVDDARGASAIVNAMRSVRMLVPMSEEEGLSFEVYERERYFRIVPAKSNLVRRGAEPEWREIVGVPLGNMNHPPSMAERPPLPCGEVEKSQSMNHPPLEGGSKSRSDFGEGHTQGGGDIVGAVRRWDPPSLATNEQLAAIKEALKSGEFRLDVRAENWAGKPIAKILSLDVGAPEDRATLRRNIKRWLRDGTLQIEEKMDVYGKPKPHVTARDAR